MTTATTSPASSVRGRGLDALFESAPSPAATSAEVEADLAALLDIEVRAAQGVSSPSAATPSAAPAATPVSAGDTPSMAAGAAATGGGVPSSAASRPQPVEVPPGGTGGAPSSAASRPQSAPIPPSAGGGAPPPTASRPQPAEAPSAGAVTESLPPVTASGLPVTRRFGAIIMESAPAPAATGSAAARSDAGVGAFAEEEVVGPAGELIAAEGEAPAVAGRAALEVRSAPSGPGAEPTLQPLPVAVERSEDQKTIIISRLDKVLDKGWQKALHAQIDELYKQAATEFSSPPANAEKALALLREARQILIETPEEYVAAEYRTLQVRAMLSRTRESRKQAQYWGPRLLGYEVGWLFLFLLGLVLTAPLGQAIGRLGNIADATMAQVFPFWSTMMWGGIGGVIGALYHLWWHISDRQDFDRQYFMWYLVQPIMGMVLGGIVFLLLAGGLLVLQVNLTDKNASTAAQLLPYLLAVLGGFRQNFVYEQFDRLIALFTPGAGRRGEGEGEKG